MDGSGTAVVNASASFEYIDLWSSRTTWGGGPPPGRGDTVWIPVVQKVLLDVSPPRLYLIVVQVGVGAAMLVVAATAPA